jgi:glycerol-3-phosphate acyltransferase PlsY
VFFGLAPLAALVALLCFILTVALTRYVSLGSLVAAVTLPTAVLLIYGATPIFWISAAIGLFVFYTHRGNIARLRAGTEPKLGARRPEATSV